jgi:hypothetical protein
MSFPPPRLDKRDDEEGRVEEMVENASYARTCFSAWVKGRNGRIAVARETREFCMQYVSHRRRRVMYHIPQVYQPTTSEHP